MVEQCPLVKLYLGYGMEQDKQVQKWSFVTYLFNELVWEQSPTVEHYIVAGL